MNPKLLRYYKKKMHGGRSFAARVSDFIMLRVFLLFFIFIIILYLSLSTTVALLISVFMTTAISLLILVINRKRTEKFIISELKTLKQKCLLEKLTFMNINDYADYINALFDNDISAIEFTADGFKGKRSGGNIYVLHNHPSGECTVSDVLDIYRKFGSGESLTIVSLSEFSPDAIKMYSALPVDAKTIDGKSVLKMAESKGMLPDEEEARGNAMKEMIETAVTFEKAKSAALSKTKIKGYIICGIIIMCWPLITGFRIYYPIIAIVCFVLAAVSYRYSRNNGKESSGT